MPAPRQAIVVILFVLISLFLVFGSLSLALAESHTSSLTLTYTSTATATSTPSPTLAIASLSPTTLATKSTTPSTTPSRSPSPSPTGTTSLSSPCPSPADWTYITVQSGDTLESLAERFQTSVSILRQNNCLTSEDPLPGELLNVPPLPTSTATPIHCGPPYGWVQYTVKKGDNLFRIGLAYGLTVTRLQQANCMGNSTYLYVGQRLWVPSGPTLTPTKKSKK